MPEWLAAKIPAGQRYGQAVIVQDESLAGRVFDDAVVGSKEINVVYLTGIDAG